MAGSSGTGSGNGKGNWASVLVFVVFMAAMLNAALQDATSGPQIQEFLEARWLLLVAAAVAILGFLFLPMANKTFATFTDANKGLVMTVVATPLLVVLLNAIFLLPDNWRGTIFKVLFVLVAAILPAVMYYLFIITRRPSLFDEFVTNLGRLGLLSTNRRQVDAYLQRFEAAYGPLPDHEGTLDEIFGPTAEPSGPQSSPTGSGAGSGAGTGTGTGTGTGWGRLVETRVGSLMTPSILLPQALCTLLVGLGWMLVLPVWDLNVSLVEPEMTPVGFGFLGAYFYSMQALFRRFLRRDLRPAV